MTTPTTLMPLDPAVSPQRAVRILPIRANLLPEEITSGRNARRTRVILAGAVLLVLVVLGAWYLYADIGRNRTADELTAVSGQVDEARGQTQKKEYKNVTDVINQSDLIDKQLSVALADDLPWATLTSDVRATGTGRHVVVTTVTGTLDSPPAKTGSATDPIGTMTVAGTAPDKKTIAGYVDALGGVHGLANVYLTAANQDNGDMTFTLNADITATALCGRFTTPCKSGGK
jgi:Tfp pilus assembly protein PilN